jgi:ferredoxin-NADP reductase/Na+-transporting NADH:ubiquinone oxidoreductase subunit NqrB
MTSLVRAVHDRIEGFLSAITMYRLVAYGLTLVALLAIALASFGVLQLSAAGLAVSLVVLLASSALINWALASLLRVPANAESWTISALILFFVLNPPATTREALFLVVTAFVAMASKFVLAPRHKHLFNPVAFALVVMGALGSGAAIWWAGSKVLLPAFLVLGILVVWKIRRFALLGAFVAAAACTIIAYGLSRGAPLGDLALEILVSWPLVFFGTIMLTEPLTTPPTKPLQVAYGALVGVLFGAQFHVGPFFSTPEFALVVGNLFSYAVSPKRKLMLRLTGKREVAKDVWEFVFAPDAAMGFEPGQYFEWTLAHAKSDDRGNRRYFTIASSPTEPEIRLGVRMAQAHPSSFKAALLAMKEGESLLAGQLAGDFTLPRDPSRKLVWIAGGIGVTPFRSMAKYLADKGERRDVALFYAAADPAAFAYRDVFAEAGEKSGLRTTYVLAGAEAAPADWQGKVGRVTPAMLAEVVPDFPARTFYLSGPNAMVENYERMLVDAGVSRRQIVKDYFPGF